MLNMGYILDEKYEVIKILGKGGMGTVYLCKNIRLDNLWAIKEVKKDSKNNRDILLEPNILKNLRHPSIPRIVDIFYEKNNFYMVQDYIEGQTLKEHMKEKGFIGSENICKIILSICDIMAYLHSLNPPIIYRDLKPSNIMITPDEKVFLIDFGISEMYKVHDKNHTICMGSKGYAAPEQYGFGQSSKLTDIYGIGMVMYFMTTARDSYTGLEPLMDYNYDKNIDNDLKKIIQKCVQIHVENRYESIENLKNEIIEFLEKDKYEQTVVLNNSNINPDIAIKNTTVSKSKKSGLKRSIKALLVFITIILVSVYFFYGNSKKDEETNNIDKQLINDTTQSMPKVQEDIRTESMKESTIEEINEEMNEEINKEINEEINEENDEDDYEKKETKPKGKGKAKGKKNKD